MKIINDYSNQRYGKRKTTGLVLALVHIESMLINIVNAVVTLIVSNAFTPQLHNQQLSIPIVRRIEKYKW